MLLKQKHRLGVSIALAALFLTALPTTAFAHVKWFSEFSFSDKPLTLVQAMTPVYLGLIVLSMVVIGGMVLLDRQLDQISWYARINKFLSDKKENSVPVMRTAMAAVLLISWASGSVLTPELTSDSALLVWMQLILSALLIFKSATPIAGIGLIALYLLTGLEFGFFHLLDYLHYAGIGIYLMVSNSKHEHLQGIGLPALYATIGFSLIWLGYEKLIYPSWSLYLLAENPQLALGLPPEFFLQGAAFVEIALGYLLIIGLLERPLAAIITLVFFSTTLIFGKIEIIGHTPLHAALIIFLFSGPGTIYKPPIAIHKKTAWRVAFAAVNFVIIAVGIGTLYTTVAQWQYNIAITQDEPIVTNQIELGGEPTTPRFETIEIIPELDNRYNLHVVVRDWQFTPELTGGPSFPNQGHGHVTVNGRDAGHLYGEWLSLGKLAPGDYEIKISLHGNDHSEFVVNGSPFGITTILRVPAE